MKRMAPFFRVLWAFLAIGLFACAGKRHAPPPLPAGAAPESPNAYYFFAESQMQRLNGETEASMHSLRRALEKDANSLYLKWELAQLYRQKKETDQALQILEEILAVEPEDTDALRLYAQILQEMDRIDPAMAAYEKVIALGAGEERDYLILGRLYQTRGDRNNAFRVYRQLVQRYPASFVGHYFIGKLHREKGQYPGAEKALHKALQLEPELVEPRFELVRLYRSEGYGYQSITVKAGETVSDIAERIYGRFDAEVIAGIRRANPNLRDLGSVQAGQVIRMPWSKFIGPESVEQILDRLIVETYQEILSLRPGNVQASIELGLWHWQQGRRNEAEAIFRQLGQRSLTENAVLSTVVRQYFEQNAFSETELMLQEMLKEAPDSPDLHYVLGLTLNELDRKAEALRHFRAVGVQSEFYENATINIAYILQQRGALDEAIEHMERAVDAKPENVEFKLYLASFYEEVKAYEKAEALLQKAVQMDPENPKVHFRLGVVYDKQGRKQESISSMKTVIQLDPEHANALNYLGYTYADMGIRLDEAERLIRRALKKRPDDGYIPDSLGWVFYKRGEYRKALEVIQKAVELVPDDPVILEHLGDVYLKLGNRDRALEYYRKSEDAQEGDTSGIEEKIRSLTEETP